MIFEHAPVFIRFIVLSLSPEKKTTIFLSTSHLGIHFKKMLFVCLGRQNTVIKKNTTPTVLHVLLTKERRHRLKKNW